MIIFAVILEAAFVAGALYVRDYYALRGHDDGTATVVGFIALLAFNVTAYMLAGIGSKREDKS